MRKTFVISVVATKGGVGKTTIAANLGGLLADLGFKVLLVDADMQPSLTKYYGLAEPFKRGLAEVLYSGGLIQKTEIVRTTFPNLDLIGSNMTDQIQAWLKERTDGLVLLKRAVRQPAVRENYDFVIVDTQGAKGQLQRAAAMAADLMVSPLCPKAMEYAEFQTGTLSMLNELGALSDFGDSFRPPPLAVVINNLDRTIATRAIEAQIRKTFGNHETVRLLNTVIHSIKAYHEARLAQTAVHRYDPEQGKATPSGYMTMHRLAHELCPWLDAHWVETKEGQA